MKKLALLFFSITGFVLSAQTDSLKQAYLDNLSYDELFQIYKNEPEPYPFYKGPDIGDSSFRVLRPLTIGTQTVLGESLTWHKYHQEALLGRIEPADTSNTLVELLKPKIALGYGKLSFYGDLGKKHFQPMQIARFGFDLAITQRLTRYLQLDFTALTGKLASSEWLNNRNENFQSEIRAGGINLLYDFGNFFSDKYSFRPYVSLGVVSFEFLSKTDLRDANGNLYYYWSDGSIKNLPEGAANAQNAVNLTRDYKYESDIRELNKDGFGKYVERAWAFPIGTGVMMKVTDRVDAKINFQYFISTTDNVDGISNKSVGNRVGNKRHDNFTYASVSLQYDLFVGKKSKPKEEGDNLNSKFWLALENEDSDKDGVKDLQDACAQTPDGAKVDLKGCPLDEDNDGVPNFKDDELTTAPGVAVNQKGVGLTDEYWKNWYDSYMNDTVDINKITVVVTNFYDLVKNIKAKKKRTVEGTLTIELARYPGAIPSDELAYMLSIGDINTTTLPDGSTVVYTNSNYANVEEVKKRLASLKSQGFKNARISKISGKNFIPVTDDELEETSKSQKNVANNSNEEKDPNDDSQSFGQNDIVYRVQLGAYKNRISPGIFNTSAGSILELKTAGNIYRYVTKGYKTIDDAAGVRADLVIQGYDDAFVTAYKNGQRVPLNQTSAVVDKEFKEDMREDKIFSSVNKKLVAFKIQLGPPKKKLFEDAMDAKFKDIPDVNKESTLNGNIRFTTGNFHTKIEAEKFLETVLKAGIEDAFLIAEFKNEIISLQEAQELLGN